MSTSRARFRCWLWASALLVALCAASLLLFGGSDTSAWDTEGVNLQHKTDSHAGGNGWLNTKHIIGSKVEGGRNNPMKGCRSLLNTDIVEKERGPTPVSILVDLGVNFSVENCVDFYECDTEASVPYTYERSEWKEDHHHGSTTGSGITHHSTYTIKLDGETHETGVNIHADVDAGLTSACGGTPPVVPPTTVSPVAPTTFTLTVAAHFSPDLTDGDANDAPVTVTQVPAQSLDGCTPGSLTKTPRRGVPQTWELVNRPGGAGGTQCRYVLQIAQCPVSTHRFSHGMWGARRTDATPVVVDEGDDGVERIDAHYDGPCVSDPEVFVLRVNIVFEPPLAPLAPGEVRPDPQFAVTFGGQQTPEDQAAGLIGPSRGCLNQIPLDRFIGADGNPVLPSALSAGEPAVLVRSLPRRNLNSDGRLCHYIVRAPAQAKDPHRDDPDTPNDEGWRFVRHEYPNGRTSTSTAAQRISDRHPPDGTETVTLVYRPPEPPEPPIVCAAGSTFAGRLVSELVYDSDGDGLTGRADGDTADCFIYCPANGGDYANQVVPSEVVQHPPGVWLAVDSEIDAAVNVHCSFKRKDIRTASGTPGTLRWLDNSACQAGSSAADHSASVKVGDSVGIWLLDLNVAPGVGPPAIVAGPFEGNLSPVGSNGVVTYTPHPWASRQDAFIYRNPAGCEAIVSITIGDRRPQPAFAATDRTGDELTSDISSTKAGAVEGREGGHYERKGDLHTEDFEHRLWTTADGYDSSTYECSQTWRYKKLVQNIGITDDVWQSQNVSAGDPRPATPGHGVSPSGWDYGTKTYTSVVERPGGFHTQRRTPGMHVHGSLGARHNHNSDHVGLDPDHGHRIRDEHTWHWRRTVYTYEWQDTSHTLRWKETNYRDDDWDANGDGLPDQESCSSPETGARSTGNAPNHVSIAGVDEEEEHFSQVNTPWQHQNLVFCPEFGNLHFKYSSIDGSCRAQTGSAKWDGSPAISNIKRHYYPGGDGANGSGGNPTVAGDNVSKLAFDVNDDLAFSDAEIAAAANHPRNQGSRPELLLTPDLPHYRTLWFMRKFAQTWPHWWKQGRLVVDDGQHGSPGGCTGEGGRAPAPQSGLDVDTGREFQVVCDPDGDLALDTLQLLDDANAAALLSGRLGLDANTGHVGTPSWLHAMSPNTMGFVCDQRSPVVSEWRALNLEAGRWDAVPGCFGMRRGAATPSPSDNEYADLDDRDAEVFRGWRRGDQQPALNYDLTPDDPDAPEHSPYHQQPYDIKQVDRKGSFSLENERDTTRGAMSCPWTTDANYFGAHTHTHDSEHHDLNRNYPPGHSHDTHNPTPHTHASFHHPTKDPLDAFEVAPYPDHPRPIHPWRELFVDLHPANDVLASQHTHWDSSWPAKPAAEQLAWIGRLLLLREGAGAQLCQFHLDLIGNVTTPDPSGNGTNVPKASTSWAFNPANPDDDTTDYAQLRNDNPDENAGDPAATTGAIGEWVNGWRWNEDTFDWFNDTEHGRSTAATKPAGYTVHLIGTKADATEPWIVVRYCVCDERYGAWKNAGFPPGYGGRTGRPSAANHVADYCTIFDMLYNGESNDPPEGTPAV